MIAGALENGSLDLWDADKLINGSRFVRRQGAPRCRELADRTTSSDAVISRMTKHSGAIKALQFNPKHSNLLATGGAKGEVIGSADLLLMF